MTSLMLFYNTIPRYQVLLRVIHNIVVLQHYVIYKMTRIQDVTLYSLPSWENSSQSQKLVLWFTSSPIITAIITTLILEFKKEGDSLFTFALKSIKEAMALDMDNFERFNYVKSKLVRKFPESSENLINAVIESVLILYKKQ
jgi:cytochrome b subunit of formate dehydrogenase